MKRPRGRRRSGGGGNNNNPNRHFESNGPDVKIRGSAQQILDKYLQYARDAQTAGERITSEAYMQHAEHYFRLVAQMQPKSKPAKEDGSDNEASDEAETDKAEAEVEEAGAGADDKAETANDPLKVIDEPAEAEAESEDGDKEAAPKPRRRRAYRKKAEAEAEEGGDDGVLKTLSRGRAGGSDEPEEDRAAETAAE